MEEEEEEARGEEEKREEEERQTDRKLKGESARERKRVRDKVR
jgi:hypothetical protein